jgi:DNA-binding NtrC family response regulator
MGGQQHYASYLEVDHGRCLVAASAAMRQVRELIERLATTDTTVFISGETGTGKELVARLIHKLSRRGARRMVAEDCNAVTPTLFESALFGHERGAFTGADRPHVGLLEAADGGTLFLDEIANLSMDLQARLLRVLQEREFRRLGGQQVVRSDFRLITATNADLSGRVRAGTFRDDLLHRLMVARIDLPPLRARRADIPVLASYFVEDKRIRLGRPAVCRVSHAAMDALSCHDWPGNVRELENVVETAILACSGDTIEFGHLTFAASPDGRDPGGDEEESSFRAARRGALAAFERRYLVTQLRRHAGNVAETARHGGITSKHIRALMRRHGIERRNFQKPGRRRAEVGR